MVAEFGGTATSKRIPRRARATFIRASNAVVSDTA